MRLDESQRLYLKALCKRSLYHLCIICGGHVHQGGDISPITHRQLCEFSQDNLIPRKGIAMSRKLRKTTVFQRWKSIWAYLNDPEERILLGSQAIGLVTKSMIWIKQQFAQNEMLRWLFREELADLNKRWLDQHRYSNTEIEMPRRGMWAEATFTAIGVGGGSQGNHYTRILLTDIIGQKEMESQIEMESAMLWCDNTPELLIDGNKGEIQYDFTHWKTGDAYEYIQEKYSEFQWRIIPGLKCSEELLERAKRGHKNIVYVQHPDQAVGETNYPDVLDDDPHSPTYKKQLFPTEYFIEMRENPERERIFWSQMMNMPYMAESGNNSFRHDWLRWYRSEAAQIGPGPQKRKFICSDDKEEFDPDLITWVGCIDPGGFSEMKMKKSSRCAAIIAGQAPNSNKKFVAWAWSGRPESPSRLMDVIFKANKDWRVRFWYIERIGAADYIFKDIKEEAEKRHEKLAIVGTPKDASSMSDNAKSTRITGLINPIWNGEYYFLPSMKELISEITSFPGITMDLIDCLSWLNKLRFSGKAAATSTATINDRRYADTLAKISPTTGY